MMSFLLLAGGSLDMNRRRLPRRLRREVICVNNPEHCAPARVKISVTLRAPGVTGGMSTHHFRLLLSRCGHRSGRDAFNARARRGAGCAGFFHKSARAGAGGGDDGNPADGLGDHVAHDAGRRAA